MLTVFVYFSCHTIQDGQARERRELTAVILQNTIFQEKYIRLQWKLSSSNVQKCENYAVNND
jgi:hypothetical protein